MDEIRFGDLVEGQTFFDPVSGEYYTKLGPDRALWGGDQSDQEEAITDPFDPEDMVELDTRDGDPDPGDMDGDHDSAMASAGFGTDEDYGGTDERY